MQEAEKAELRAKIEHMRKVILTSTHTTLHASELLGIDDDDEELEGLEDINEEEKMELPGMMMIMMIMIMMMRRRKCKECNRVILTSSHTTLHVSELLGIDDDDEEEEEVQGSITLKLSITCIDWVVAN